ncbi:exodeoxyribonuclease VII large subunit [Pelagibacterium limicola]|uniref:exodeoxyribonuclease VII large subunit n=1 Tax=Pelagibacterium limicola TaxID=2791022 RepID=UPI0018AFABF1|nr:exodeoxyribonuclease VII large subunit [Pelagibacterium limicola]
MTDAQSNAHEFTVSEVANAVKRTIEDQFGFVRVRGEVSGYRGPHSSGHAYFTLKDEGATIDAVVWKGNFARLAFKPEEGLEVIATGRLTTYPRSSKYQIVIEQIEPAGAGALMALLEERRKKLLAEGLFAPERKCAIPYLPRVIGVVTSPTGAVIRDILHRLEDRFPTHVIVWPVRVQGDTCASEVTRAIGGFNGFEPDGPIPRPDLLIVARGGGSIEDLWGFNEESVVRAVARSHIPIISAVGHETDITLIDYAADKRAPTPTGAAEMAVPVRGELIAYVDDLGSRQRGAARRSVINLRDRLRAASAGLPRPTDLTSTQRQRLDLVSARLESALRNAYQKKALRFAERGATFGPAILRRHFEREGLRLSSCAQRLQPDMLDRRIADFRTKLDQFGARAPVALGNLAGRAALRARPIIARLQPAFARRVLDKRRELEGVSKLIESLSYRRVLDRGFALVADEDGNIVTTPNAVGPGEALVITVAEGRIDATVSGAPSASRRKRPTEGGSQESLF